MQIILLSGGSGTRLWPLSNDARSKQFLRLFEIDGSDRLESMIQRVHRQLNEANIKADITVATNMSQVDSVISQLGMHVNIVAEPCRRDTFPAISLACEYLSKEKHCPNDEKIIVMPCDSYTDNDYYGAIKEISEGITDNRAEMIVMGITPTYPSEKFGYVIPDKANNSADTVLKVCRFTEKPAASVAEELISNGALWNGGVFAFRLGYILTIARKYNNFATFTDIRNHYNEYPKISFDYEVAEKAQNIGVVKYNGEWNDLGTWNALTAKLKHATYGNVLTDDSVRNTHVLNELNIPILCLGTQNLVVAASPDGIIVTEKSKSEIIKEYASKFKHRPMYEERRWGISKVIDSIQFSDGYCALTKQITLNPGCATDYHKHSLRDEMWTFIDGEGEIAIDGERRHVKRGDIINIAKGQFHALKATTSLTLLEVQKGYELVEEDIERMNCDHDCFYETDSHNSLTKL